MILSLLIGLFIFLSFVLAIFVLIQQGKGDLGMLSGGLSNSAQTLFGGSGGHEFFEKVTWILGIIFMAGSLGLTIMRMKAAKTSRITSQTTAVETTQTPATPTK